MTIFRFYMSLRCPEYFENERKSLFDSYADMISKFNISKNDLFIECLWEENSKKLPGLISAIGLYDQDIVILTKANYISAGINLPGMTMIPLEATCDACIVLCKSNSGASALFLEQNTIRHFCA